MSFYCTIKTILMMKRRNAFVLLTAACLAAFTVISCSKSDKKDDEPATKEEAGKIPGLGETPGTPQGTALVYPAGVTLSAEAIKGRVCDTAYEVGSGGIVEICVAIINNNAQDVTFTLPAGLIVLAEDAKYQHGLLLQEAKVVLKAKRTTRVGINMWCLNSGRLPSTGDKSYKIGPVTNSVLIGQVCNQLKNKKTTRAEYAEDINYYIATSAIQNIIWAYTDGDGYDPAALAEQLAAIPNR